MIINGNSLFIPLADGVVQVAVTSPPYWGLRDYGTATWTGGDPECDHKPDITPRKERERHGLTGGLDYMKSKDPVYKNTCSKCGAVRVDAQLGLEKVPDCLGRRYVGIELNMKYIDISKNRVITDVDMFGGGY